MNGLKYYQADTDRFMDIKIRKLIRYFGPSGYAIYDYALNEIFRNGYYITFDEDQIFWVAEIMHCKESEVEDIIEFSCKVGLFDKETYDEHRVLTSASIQRRYIAISKASKRKNDIEKYDLTGIFGKNREFSGKNGSTSEIFGKIPEEIGGDVEEGCEDAKNDLCNPHSEEKGGENSQNEAVSEVGDVTENSGKFEKIPENQPMHEIFSGKIEKIPENSGENKEKKINKERDRYISISKESETVRKIDRQIDDFTESLSKDENWLSTLANEPTLGLNNDSQAVREKLMAFATDKKSDKRQALYDSEFDFIQHFKRWLRLKKKIADSERMTNSRSDNEKSKSYANRRGTNPTATSAEDFTTTI